VAVVNSLTMTHVILKITCLVESIGIHGAKKNSKKRPRTP